MKFINKYTLMLVIGCDKSPLRSTAMIFAFYIFFSIIQSSVERLIFGEMFENWLEPIFTLIFMVWAACAAYLCGVIRVEEAK